MQQCGGGRCCSSVPGRPEFITDPAHPSWSLLSRDLFPLDVCSICSIYYYFHLGKGLQGWGGLNKDAWNEYTDVL